MSRIIAEIRYILIYAVSLLPLKVHYLFSSALAFLLQHVVRYRFTTITVNLSRSFPSLKYSEISKIAHDYYRRMCDIIVESVWDLAHSKKAICRVVEVENQELINELQQKYGSVLVLMGHCGNFELVSGMCADKASDSESFTRHPIYIGYKKAKSAASNILFRKLRMHEYRKFGSLGEVVESKAIVRHVLQNRGKKAVYVLIADQAPKDGKHVVVNFLNQPTAMLDGPEYLAVKTKMPVAYLSMDVVKRGKYKIRFTLITENASEEKDDYFVAKKYAALLEKDINANKINWLWSIGVGKE